MSNESKPDLTPAEARAEVEAFLGEHWTVRAEPFVGDEGMPSVRALRSGGVEMCHVAITYRAAVDALKQAWRDAVRPWCVKAGNAWDMDMTDEWNAREVLGEESMSTNDLPLDEAAANIQRARDRALLISQQDSDAPKLTQRLDAQAMATLVAGFDALRARVAELEKENTTIRALLVKYECPYGEKSLGECSRGFPGCACADDMLATASWCPEDEDKAAVRLGRRVAELEAELADARSGALAQRAVVVCNDLRDDADKWRMNANALRDALEDVRERAGTAHYDSMCGLDPITDIVGSCNAALASTPAATLAAYRKSVLEEAAAAAESYLWNLPAIQSQVGANCGDAIRALAAQEVKP